MEDSSQPTEEELSGCAEPSTSVSCDKQWKGLPHANGKENAFQSSLRDASSCADGDVKKHVEDHCDEMPHKCIWCDSSFPAAAELTRHTEECEASRCASVKLEQAEVILDDSTWECYVCKVSFSHENELKSHMHHHTPPIVSQSDDWDSCGTETNPDMQTRLHHVERPFSCTLCDRTFTRELSLKNHMFTHLKEKPYSCCKCGKRFVLKAKMMAHLREHNRQDGLSFTQFQASFSCLASLQNHIVTHKEADAFKCSVCKSLFRIDENIAKYMVENPGEMPRCSKCHAACVAHKELTGQTQESNVSSFAGLELTGQVPENVQDKLLKCSCCELCFSGEDQLQSHVRQHLEENLSHDRSLQITQAKGHVCPFCQKSYRNAGGFHTHMRAIHFGEKPFVCGVCDKRFAYKHAWKGHQTLHTREKPYLCPSCGIGFGKEAELRKHLHQKSCLKHSFGVEKQNKSSECSVSFSRSDSLNNHMRMPPGGMPFKCSECTMCFKDLGCLSDHLNVHSGKELRKCPDCPASFTSESDLMVHLREHTVPASELVCTVCSDRFSDPNLLEQHMKTHSEWKKIECPECPAVFMNEKDFRIHFGYHCGAFQCAICDGCFASSTLLQAHMAEHSEQSLVSFSASEGSSVLDAERNETVGEHREENSDEVDVSPLFAEVELNEVDKGHVKRPSYTCSVCKERLDIACELEEHLLTKHSEENIHRCSLCSKSFRFSKSLLYHVRTHAVDDDSLLCGECGESFSQRENLTVHMRSHTGINVFKCTVCCEYFDEFEQLRTHTMAIHKRHQCPVCKKCFARKRNLTRHMAIHERARQFVCIRCDLRFDTEVLFQLHLSSHDDTGVRPHRSTDTSNEREDGSSLVCPRRVQTGKTIVKCPVCTVSFGNASHLEVHIILKHTEQKCTNTSGNKALPAGPGELHSRQVVNNAEENHTPSPESEAAFAANREGDVRSQNQSQARPYTCSSCGYNIFTLNDLLRHYMEEHPERKLFQCLLCEDSFSVYRELELHFQKHTIEEQNSLSLSGAVLPVSLPRHLLAEKQHECPMCTSTFLTYEALTEHMEVHLDEMVCKCSVCDTSFSSIRELTKHMQEHAGHLKCFFCEMGFSQSVELESHLRKHMEEYPYKYDRSRNTPSVSAHQNGQHIRPYLCVVCHIPFSSSADLMTHMIGHTSFPGIASTPETPSADRRTLMGKQPKTVPYKCSVCKLSFGVKRNFLSHVRIHSLKKPHACEVCSVDFSTRINLRNHMKSHAQSFKCSVCEKRFHRKENLMKHMEIHSKETRRCEVTSIDTEPTDRVKCTVCDESFLLQKYLREHLKSHSKKVTKCAVPPAHPRGVLSHPQSVKCTVCRRSFSHNKYLKVHMRIHSQRVPLECTVCKKSFSQKNAFLLHMRTHSEKVPLKCTTCKKNFTRKNYLLRHMKTHIETTSVECSHECTTCKRSFRRKSSLAVHMKIHSDRDPVECTVCKRSFKEEAHMKQHVTVVHLRANPEFELPPFNTHTVKCTLCERPFSHRKYLLMHMKTHPAKCKFPCAECGKSFDRLVKLKAHRAAQHTAPRCSVCMKTFTTLKRLRMHVRLHMKAKPYCCSVCGVTFNGSNRLDKHIVSKHVRQEAPRCYVCDKRFAFPSSLARHMEIHEIMHENMHGDPKAHPYGNQERRRHEMEESRRHENGKLPVYENEESHSYQSEKYVPADHKEAHHRENGEGQRHENKESHEEVNEELHHDKNEGFNCHEIEVSCRYGNEEPQYPEHGNLNHLTKGSNHSEDGKSPDDKNQNSPQLKNEKSQLHQNKNRLHREYEKSERKGQGEVESHKRENEGDQSFVREQDPSHEEDVDKYNSSLLSGGKPYKCAVCSECLSESEQLRLHMLKHTEPFLRIVRKTSDSFKRNLKRRRVLNQKEKSYICAACDACFDRDVSLRIHKMIHGQFKLHLHQSCSLCKKRICPVCKKRFVSGKAMRYHRRLHNEGNKVDLEKDEISLPGEHYDKPYKCPLCEKHFRNSRDVNIHLKRHATSKRMTKEYLTALQYQCPKCDKRFKFPRSLRWHLQAHDETNPCSVCKKSFYNEFSLQQHMRIHTGEKPFSCPVCKIGFRQKTGLRWHMCRIHPGEDIPRVRRGGKNKQPVSREPRFKKELHKCSECALVFLTEEQLQTHLTESNHRQKEKRKKLCIKCPECQTGFSTQAKLNRHMKKHGDGTPYKCEVCGEGFKFRALLVQHRLLHASEDRPFKCHTCGGHFKTKGILATHQRVHTREKSFKCSKCTGLYTSNQLLQKHLPAHDSPDAVVCSVCGMCFKNKNVLKVHKNKHKESQ